MSLEWRFQVCFWQQKRRGAARRRQRSSSYKHKRRPSSSMPQHHKGADERKWTKTFWFRNRCTLWPEIYSSLWTKCFSFLFSCFFFFFFFCRTFSSRENTSLLFAATPVPHKEHRASVAQICLHCSKEEMYILAKQCVRSERCAMPCRIRRRAVFVMRATNPEVQTKLSLQDFGLVVCLNLAKAKSFHRQTWQTYRKGYKLQRLYT